LIDEALCRLDAGVVPKVSALMLKLDDFRMSTRDFDYRRTHKLNKAEFVMRQSLTKPFRIESVNLTGYRLTYGNAYIIRSGDTLTFSAKYISTRSGMGLINQKIGNVEKYINILFPTPNSYYDLSLDYTLQNPEKLTCVASIKPKALGKGDTITQIYPIGIFDLRDKPVSEYPVSGVDNYELDIAYSWEDMTYIYPTPPPEVMFSNITFTLKSGFATFEDNYYRDPDATLYADFSFRISTAYNDNVTIKHWGILVGVMYEDTRHVSEVDVTNQVGKPADVSGYNASAAWSFNNVPFPSWAYGKVFLIYALKIFKGSEPVYYGGPVIQFTIGRLRLP